MSRAGAHEVYDRPSVWRVPDDRSVRVRASAVATDGRVLPFIAA